MPERQPTGSHYDAEVDLAGALENARIVTALVKQTFEIRPQNRSCVLTEPEPLVNDLRDPELEPRMPPHSDFWPRRPRTDFGVVGSALPEGGRPVEVMDAGVRVGHFEKRVRVFGRRAIEWVGDAPRIAAPEPFEELPICFENAYGGIDYRVPVAEDDPKYQAWLMRADHPGVYPRNPFGRGFLAVDAPLEEAEMPNLEDPEDLLTAGRLVADAARWYEQPLPWSLDFMSVASFPRCSMMALEGEPWHAPPDDERLPEVRRGYLPAGYRAALASLLSGQGPLMEAAQEASHGLAFDTLAYGTPVEVFGMNAEYPRLEFALPPHPPRLEIEVDGRRTPVAPQLACVVCRPAELRLTLTWTAYLESPRRYVPGIHKRIPVSLHVDGDTPVAFDTPETVREKLARARAEGPEPPA